MNLNGKHVVITGGSRGIGAAMGRAFARQGARVLVAARSVDALQHLASQIDGEFLPVDLTDDKQVDGFVTGCLRKLGHIDVFVNNAGLENSKAFVDEDRDLIRQILRVNLEVPALLIRDVLPHLMERPEAHVVHVSSVAGTLTFPGLSVYGASKAGLTQLHEGIRMELRDTSVGFTLAAPGPVHSEMWDRIDAGSQYASPAIRRFERLLSLPKVTPDQVAADIVAAVEEGCAHVRGPLRYAPYHMLNNAPRRLVELALTGVSLPRKP